MYVNSMLCSSRCSKYKAKPFGPAQEQRRHTFMTSQSILASIQPFLNLPHLSSVPDSSDAVNKSDSTGSTFSVI